MSTIGDDFNKASFMITIVSALKLDYQVFTLLLAHHKNTIVLGGGGGGKGGSCKRFQLNSLTINNCS